MPHFLIPMDHFEKALCYHGVKVVDTSFISGNLLGQRDHMPISTDELKERYDFLAAHADKGLTFPQETLDEFDRAITVLRRAANGAVNLPNYREGKLAKGGKREFGKATRDKIRDHACNLEEKVRLMKKFKREVMLKHPTEALISDEARSYLPVIQETVSSVSEQALLDRVIEPNDHAIYAKTLALAYSGVTSPFIVSGDCDFKRLTHLYPTIRFQLNVRGLPDAPHVPLAIISHPAELCVYRPYQREEMPAPLVLEPLAR